MATQRFNAADLLGASRFHLAHPAQLTSYAATFARAHAIANSVLRTEVEWPSEAVVNLRLLRKGVGWALGIEGATAMCLYAIWFLWHL